MEHERGPESLFEFIVMILKAYITGIPSIIKSMIVSVVLSAVVTNAIHFYLMGWVNNGWNNGGNPWLDPVLFLVGQDTAKVMLFYFMVTYLFWWVIGMFRSRGIGSTVKMIATAPIWIVKSLTSIGFAVFPMLMGGLAVSFVLGLTVLTNPTAITMFLMMLTVLISQDESLIIMGLQFGFKDASGLVNRDKKATIPSAHLPSAALFGAAVGFGYIAFLKPSTMVIGGIALLSIAGLVYMFIRNRRSPEVAVIVTLFVLVSAVAIMAPMVHADDGGIPENGGWSNLLNNPWLIQELIRKGYPASVAATIAAALISGLFSPPVLSKIKPLGAEDGYVDKKYTDAVPGDRKITQWKFVRDPAGTYVDGDGNKYRREETRGLPESIINGEDNPGLGEAVRIFTLEPPKDQAIKDVIKTEVMKIDKSHLDRLHPDNWKNLTAAERTDTLTKVSDALKKSMGIDYDFEVIHDNKKGLGGSFRRQYTTNNPDGTQTVHRPLLKINSNGNIFDDPRTALRTIIHETRHAYQKKIGDPNGTDYQRIVDYNNNHIQSSRTDYVRYGESLNERDSRSFGQDTANQLIGELNKMWGH